MVHFPRGLFIYRLRANTVEPDQTAFTGWLSRNTASTSAGFRYTAYLQIVNSMIRWQHPTSQNTITNIHMIGLDRLTPDFKKTRIYMANSVMVRL